MATDSVIAYYDELKQRTAAGLKIGTGTNAKIAFFAATPIAQKPRCLNPDDFRQDGTPGYPACPVDIYARVAINVINQLLQEYGLTSTQAATE